MTKHRQTRSLFDLLRKERQTQPTLGAVKSSPVARPVSSTASAPTPAAPPAATVSHRPQVIEAARPAPMVSRPRPASAGRAGGLIGQVTDHHLAIAGVAVTCLCVIAFAVGRWSAPETLPVTQKEPTMETIQSQAVTPGLVAQTPTRLPAVGRSTKPSGPSGRSVSPAVAPAAAPPAATEDMAMPMVSSKPAATEPPTPPPPPALPATGGLQFRVRIARLAVSQPDAIDRMRTFLAQNSVETELDTRGGYYVLYSRERFSDKKKSDEAAAQINKHLAAFEKQTRIPTSKDAYSIQVTKE